MLTSLYKPDQKAHKEQRKSADISPKAEIPVQTKSLFSFLDAGSRIQSAQAQNASVGAAHTQPFPVIQRRAVYDGPKPPVDINIIDGLDDVVAKAGGPVVNNKDAYDYTGDNTIGILAHGDLGEIEWKGNDLDGKRFANEELLAKSIKPNTKVYLWSCGAGEPKESKSVCDDVADELKAKGKTGIEVSGVTGSTHIVVGPKHYKLKNDDKASFDAYMTANITHLKTSGFFPPSIPKDRDFMDFIHDITEMKPFENETAKSLGIPEYSNLKKAQFRAATPRFAADAATMALLAEVADAGWYTATSVAPAAP